jgi:hypothetical protein
MSWDGVERRKEIRYCDNHIDLMQTVARIEERLIAVDKRINGSIDSIEKHIEHGSKWRLTIATIGIGLLVTIFTRFWGWAKFEKQIEINTGRLDKIEARMNK